MEKRVLYLHGQGGTAKEAEHYRSLFPGCSVVGMDYKANTPWEAEREFPALFDALCPKDGTAILVANSIGAYFAIHALADRPIAQAFLISPIVDMEALILQRMARAGVTETRLRVEQTVIAASGESFSWAYLDYARTHPTIWSIPTEILYGARDTLTSYETMVAFAARIHAGLTVMENGEHWFRTPEQMQFLGTWILQGAQR